MIRRVEIEGAAAGFYVAALFESAHPNHRGLNAARLARDAKAATRSLVARGRLHLARRIVHFPNVGAYAGYPVEYGTGPYSAPRPRGAGRPGRRKSRRGAAA